MKNAMTPAGIEPGTFRFLAQQLNHCATAVPNRLLETGSNLMTFRAIFDFLNVEVGRRQVIVYGSYISTFRYTPYWTTCPSKM